jgi:hypothetical protein
LRSLDFFIGLGEIVDALHADLLRVDLGVKASADHGIAEVAGILVQHHLELLRGRIEGRHLLANLLGEGAVAEHVLADVVARLANALVMTAEAGDGVGHRAIELAVVEHNLSRPLVEADALGRVQIIGLEAVRQAEDGLAAVMLEGIGPVRTKRVDEQALLRLVALEVVRGPEIAGADAMAFDQPVVPGDARLLEAGALDQKLLDVALDVEIGLLLKLGEARG